MSELAGGGHRARPHIPAPFLSCLLAALLAGLTGCNVIAMKQAGIERVMRGAGLTPRTRASTATPSTTGPAGTAPPCS